MNIHYLQHVPFEGLASIQGWATERGHRLSATHLFEDEALPPQQDFDWLIVMGGSMNICETEKYFWMTEEKRFIEQAIKSNKTVIGICLGAQLIADVLGAKVTQNEFKEIGWFPIDLTEQAWDSTVCHSLPHQFNALHWHGDTFDLPSAAVQLARSEGCENQAFVYGEKILSLQFHLEVTKESVPQIIENCGDELVEGKYIQRPETILARDNFFAQANQMMWQILDNLSF